MALYLLRVADTDARALERRLGGALRIGPADLGELGVPVAGLDAVTAEECAAITERLATGGPVYHAGGPGGG